MRSEVRWVSRILLFLAAIIGLYWGLWFGNRSLVASETAGYYVKFEDAFPVADGLLTLALISTAWTLRRGKSTSLLWGLMATGGGFYLGGMDVLFDIEHGIWSKGAGGAIELAINVLTLSAAVVFGRWLWTRRRMLDRETEAVATPG
jgi:hypothetical protein